MSNCLFCNPDALEILAQTDLCFALRDQYPVAQLHTLIVPFRCVATPFELEGEELRQMFELAHQCSIDIATSDESIGGFNFGANIGRMAGQQIMHAHFHLIPRRAGDLEPPKAGVH